MEVNFERKDLKNLSNPQKRVEQNRIHQRKHYQSHKKYMDKAKARKKRLLEFIRDYKEYKGCKDCSLKDRRCLDFHHPEDNKEFEISNDIFIYRYVK